MAGPSAVDIEGHPALRTWEWGQAEQPPVLLLHGAGQHGRVWDGVAARLEGFRVIALDSRGHGGSHAAGRGGYTPDDYVGDVWRVLDRAAQPVALVGHSTGALVAMIAASRRPDRMWAAAFIDIDPRPPDYQRERLQAAGRRPPRAFAAIEEVEAGIRQLAPGIADEDARRLVETGYAPDPDGAWRQLLDPRTLAEFPAFDNRGVLHHISIPALVVRGRESTVSSAEAARVAVEALPHGELLTLPGGHQLHLQHPAIVGDAVRAFLEAHRP